MKIICLLLLASALASVSYAADNSDDGPGAVDASTEEDFYGYFMPYTEDTSDLLSRSFSFVRYRLRGYDNRFNDIRIGDTRATDMADGSVYWNMVSAVRSARQTDRTRLTGALSTGSYAHRGTFGTSIGGERFSLKLFTNTRAGENGYVDGLETKLTNVGLAASANLRNQSFSLLYSGNFGWQDVRPAATGEVYDLSADNYYNAAAGVQKGETRNSRQRKYRQNFASLGHEIKLSDEWNMKSSAAIFAGENSYGLLSWYGAPTPYPDYYRYLPGFFGNPEIASALAGSWAEGDPKVTGINWRQLYEANMMDPEGRSHYILRDLVSDKTNVDLSAVAEYDASEELKFTAGAEYRLHRSSNYARLDDLLGGGYWMDIDQYLLDDEYYGDMLQSDTRNPGRMVREGERFGYNYDMAAESYRGKGSVRYETLRWHASLEAEAGRTTFTRTGRYEKENFPDKLSYGKSKPVEFREYHVTGALSRNFTLRETLSAGFTASAHAPLARNLFISPEYRNATITSRTVKMIGAEAAYSYLSPVFSLRAGAYYTRFADDTQVTDYYDDLLSEYSNMVMSGIEKVHAGVELYASAPLTPSLTVTAEAAVNVYKYDSDPTVDIYRDKDGRTMVAGARSMLSGFHIGGAPERAAALRFAYRFPARWNFTLSGNYAGGNYVSPNPVRRMTRVMDLAGSPEIMGELLHQERFDDFVTADLTLSKDFYMGGSRLGFWLSVSNLLDNRSIKYGGYEQMRFARTAAESGRLLVPFKPKFYYAYGRTVYLLISLTI